jgi:hypothetical protein
MRTLPPFFDSALAILTPRPHISCLMTPMNWVPNGQARLLPWLTLPLALANAAPAASVTVAMTSPAQGELMAAPGSVILGAVAQGAVEWVDFYQDGNLVGWAEDAPFTFEWGELPPGPYTIEAHAMTANGESIVSSPVTFYVVAPAGASLTRGPYIMMGHFTNRSTIVWRTDLPTDGWVEYGLSSAYGLATGSAAPSLQHEVTLTNLLPGRTYHYRVRSGGETLAADEFRSGKLPGSPVRVAWTCDHRSGAGGPIAAVIKTCKPDLILDGGDLMSWCNAGALDAEFFADFGDTLRQSPFYWTPGNHEGNNCAACLEAFDLLPEDHQSYAIEYGDILAVALNANQPPPPGWLRQKLAASSKPWKFVFTHVPAYSAAGGHGELEGGELRAHYVPLMEEYKVAACITGHNHYYWRSQPIHGVTHLVVGSGGAPLYDLVALPPYTAAANDTTEVFAYADIEGDFMHFHATDQFNRQVDELVVDRRCQFQLDGQLDASATPVAQRSGGLTLWAAVAGRYLYVATTNATSEDHFILLSRTLSEQMTDLGPVWAKQGLVMAYDAYLAGQAATMSNGWFNGAGQPFDNLRVARSTTRLSQDGVLEGVIDLEALYGAIPPVVYLAAAPFSPNPGGLLDPAGQCPVSNGDSDIQPDEFVAVNTAAITAGDGRLTALMFTPDGTAILDFLGEPNAIYVIEASMDLQAWYPLGSQIADSRGWFQFNDYDAGLFQQQFYRTRRSSGP